MKQSLPRVNDSFLDKVIYINLDHRIDRKASIERQLSVFPKEKIFRFPGIYQAASGFMGCAQSHIRVLEIAIQNQFKNILIVEDDMIWNQIEKHYCIFEYLATTKPYDVIVLGGSKAIFDKETLKVTQVEAPVAYLVNNTYYNTLLENYQTGLNLLIQTNYPQSYCLDQYWKSLQPAGNWYIVRPCLSYQGNDFSDIENRFVHLKQNYISDKTEVADVQIKSLTEFFDSHSFNLYIRLALNYTQSTLTTQFDTYTHIKDYNLTVDQDFQEYTSIIQKCVVDILFVDFLLGLEHLSKVCPHISRTRFVILLSNQDTTVFLTMGWMILGKWDTFILLKNSFF
jgi:glycosyl transferase family 25